MFSISFRNIVNSLNVMFLAIGVWAFRKNNHAFSTLRKVRPPLRIAYPLLGLI